MKENRINNFGIRQLSIMGSCFFNTKIYKEDKTMKEFWNAVQFVFTAVGGWLDVMVCYMHCLLLW